ncbi:MAG: hypothetical protein XD96_1618, partial [Petrotoga mobilis]
MSDLYSMGLSPFTVFSIALSTVSISFSKAFITFKEEEIA